MKTFAQILNGLVHWVFQAETAPEFDGTVVLVDVTAVSPGPQEGWSAAEANGAWLFTAPAAPSLPQAQATQIALLSTACSASIMSGFSSSALGSAYTYPSTPADQANHKAVANCASGGLLWCETGGVWGLKQHTQAQAQAVIASFTAWLNSCQSQLATLSGNVNKAVSVAAVQAIAW